MREVTPDEAKAWREREQRRLDDGTYTRLPAVWLCSAWFQDPTQHEQYTPDVGYHRAPIMKDHFAHVSVEKVAMVAFTENDQKGVADRQTRMSPGRYLTRFFSDKLTKGDIQRLSTEMGAEYNDDAELHFAVTADEFEHVYLTGPASCMSHELNSYSSDVHPVRVYAGFDLQLAYLKRDNRITARALCWPDNKVYARVYGDAIRLERALTDIGYESGSLGGAKITRLKQRKAFVIPYLDNLSGAWDMGTHLELSDDGGRHSTTRERLCCDGDCQNGLSTGGGFMCVSCENDYDDDPVRHDDETYCAECFNARFTYCDRYGDYYPDDEVQTVLIRKRHGDWVEEQWCESARDSHAFYCDKDDVHYSNINNSYDVDGVTWGPEAFDEYGATCAATGKHFHVDDTVTLTDGTVWSTAYWEEHKDEATVLERTFAEIQANQQELSLPVEPQGEIVVGCMVKCIKDCPNEFTAGKLYKVIRIYDDGVPNPRISVAQDDKGDENGWNTKHFVFHSPPPDPSVIWIDAAHYIKHEPEKYPTVAYRLYNASNVEIGLGGWETERDARRIAPNAIAYHAARSINNPATV